MESQDSAQKLIGVEKETFSDSRLFQGTQGTSGHQISDQDSQIVKHIVAKLESEEQGGDSALFESTKQINESQFTSGDQGLDIQGKTGDESESQSSDDSFKKLKKTRSGSSEKKFDDTYVMKKGIDAKENPTDDNHENQIGERVEINQNRIEVSDLNEIMDDFFIRNKLIRDSITQQTLVTVALFVRYLNHIEGLETLNTKNNLSDLDPINVREKLGRLEERYSDVVGKDARGNPNLIIGVIGSGIIGRVFIDFLNGKVLYGKLRCLIWEEELK